MERILALDVGMGTTDILVFEPDRPPENSLKLVVPSRTQVVAAGIRAATARGLPIVFSGVTMGGGPSTVAMRAHLAAGLTFAATSEAALTFSDDLDLVAGYGVMLVGADDAADLVRTGAVEITAGDVDLPGLLRALDELGAPTTFSGGCIAVQDHGFSPQSSNRLFRFELWERAIAKRLPLERLFFSRDEIPAAFTRMAAAAAGLAALPQVTAADTGPAALYGALDDTQADEPAQDAVLVNVGNGHIICAVALEGTLAGIYEDHTSRLSQAELEANLRRFLAGDLPGDEVREAGGHGAALGGPVPPGLPILVTGPHRDRLAGGSLPAVFPAPFGDVMMTGPAGLVRAYRRRFGG